MQETARRLSNETEKWMHRNLIMTTAVLAAACFLTGCEGSVQTEPPQDAFARRLDDALHGLTRTREDLIKEFPSSDLAHRLANLFSDIRLELRAYDNQLRKQNLPRQERVARLRERCIASLKDIHHLKNDQDSRLRYNERHFEFTFSHSDGKQNRTTIKSAAFLIDWFLDLNQGIDPVARDLNAALADFDAIYWRINDIDENFHFRHHYRALHDIKNISTIMADYDDELAAEGLSREEHIAKLRERFLSRIKKAGGSMIRYDEATSSLHFFDKSGAPFLVDGQPAHYAMPLSLVEFLKLPAPSGTPLIIHSDALLIELEKAVTELKQLRESAFSDPPTSEAAQEIVEIFVEIEDETPRYDAQLRRNNTQQERRIVMLKGDLLYTLRQFDALAPEVVFSRREEGGYFARYAPPDAPDKSVVLDLPAGLAKILDAASPPMPPHTRPMPLNLVLGSITGAVLLALALLYFIMRRDRDDRSNGGAS